jgi:hypothetical protein
MATLNANQDLYFRIIAAAATSAQTEFRYATVVGEAVDAVTKMRTAMAEQTPDGHLNGFSVVDW